MQETTWVSESHHNPVCCLPGSPQSPGSRTQDVVSHISKTHEDSALIPALGN